MFTSRLKRIPLEACIEILTERLKEPNDNYVEKLITKDIVAHLRDYREELSLAQAAATAAGETA